MSDPDPDTRDRHQVVTDWQDTMVSTKSAETLQGPQLRTPRAGEAGTRQAGLRQIGEHLTRAALEAPGSQSAPDAALHLWRDATPVP